MDNLLNNEIPREVIEKLKAPLPSESIAPHPTKNYLSTIKAIYVVERLNEVFGINGWSVKNEFVAREGKMVVVKAVFISLKYGIYVEAFGGNDNTDLGDAYKGACTDALTKIGSYLYVGMDVYKGLGDQKKTRGYSASKSGGTEPINDRGANQSPFKKATPKQIQFIKKLITEKGKPMPEDDWFADLDMASAKNAIDTLLNLPTADHDETIVQE